MKRSIVIVGAGAIGLSLAWELAGRGCKVTIIDQGEIGRGTSWTAAGILPPANLEKSTDPIDRLRGFSHELYPQWSERLLAETSIDIGLKRCGGWYLADSVGERALMAGMTNYWNDLSIQCDRVEPEQLSQREPALSAWVQNNEVDAWWVPDEYQIRPPRLIRALSIACDQSSVTKLTNRRVTDIVSDADTATAELDDGNTIGGDQVVVCSGVWTGKITERMNLDVAVIPVRGQILLLKTPEPLLGGIVNLGNRYLIAREDGHTLVGSCEEEVGFNTDTNEEMLSQLFDFAITLVPELHESHRVAAWSGLRPMTFDGFPMIGKVPGHSRLFVAAGHYRSGIHLAPGTAVALADQMQGSTPAIELDAFRIGKQQSESF